MLLTRDVIHLGLNLLLFDSLIVTLYGANILFIIPGKNMMFILLFSILRPPRLMGEGFVVMQSNDVDIYYYMDEPGNLKLEDRNS